RLQNIFPFEVRILRQKFINTATSSDLPDDHAHGNAYPTNASLAAHDFGSLCDAIQLFHAGSPGPVMQPYYSKGPSNSSGPVAYNSTMVAIVEGAVGWPVKAHVPRVALLLPALLPATGK